MNIEARLKSAQDKRQGLVNQANQLDQQRQEILQELLRIDGAVRELTLMKDEQDKVK